MFASDFPGVLDIHVRDHDQLLKIRAADPKVAVSQKLLDDLCALPGGSRDGNQIVLSGIDRGFRPHQVAYRIAGFDPTNSPEANEGGFHLLERIDPPPPDAIEQEPQ